MEEKASSKRVLFFLLLVILGSLFTLGYLILTGNAAQTYNDIIVESTAYFNSNKTAEVNLIYILSAGGILIYFLYFIRSKNKFGDTEPEIENKSAKAYAKFVLCTFFMITAVLLLVYKYIYPAAAAMLLLAAVLYFWHPELTADTAVFYILGIYAVYGVYRMAAQTMALPPLDTALVALVLLVLTAAVLFIPKRRDILKTGCLIFQLFVPGTLLIYTMSYYTYNGVRGMLLPPFKVCIFITAMIALFFAEAVFMLKKYIKSSKYTPADIVSYGTCISIMAFDRFSNSGLIMSQDLHHPFENIIGYSQVFELGQKPFSQYMPTSGLYSWLEGFAFDFWGNGAYANQNIAQNMFYLFVSILVVVLVKKHVNGIYALVLSMIFVVLDYDRVAFILPIMLLLSWPKLIEKKNAWLKTWFLTSLFHGLYYPVVGAAVCAAFMPLGIWQIYTFVKNGQFAKQASKPVFWLAWAVCIIPAVICLPLLWGTYTHIKAMADQSVLADGIARYGQVAKKDFIPWLDNFYGAKIALYYIATFMIPAVFVWAAFAAALKAGDIKSDGKKLSPQRLPQLLAGLSIIVMPLVAFTYTFVRTDVYSVYARNSGILFAGAVMLAIFVRNHLPEGKAKYAVLCLAVFVPSFVSDTGLGFLNNKDKLVSSYTVPDGYVYVENDAIKKLGRGFIKSEYYANLSDYYAISQNMDKDKTYFAAFPWFAYYYLYDIKGGSTLEAATIRGYDAARETVGILKKNGVIIGQHLNTLENYYLYHWILMSGEYVLDSDTGMFYPNTYGLDKNEVRKRNKATSMAVKFFEPSRAMAALGNSMYSLTDDALCDAGVDFDFIPGTNEVVLNFKNDLYGDTADFMYLEFDNMDKEFCYSLFDSDSFYSMNADFFSKYLMRKNYNPQLYVDAYWYDDEGQAHTVRGNMWQGKLLVPLGMDPEWLLDHHSDLHISVGAYGTDNALVDMSYFAIKDIGFYKAREITD